MNTVAGDLVTEFKARFKELRGELVVTTESDLPEALANVLSVRGILSLITTTQERVPGIVHKVKQQHCPSLQLLPFTRPIETLKTEVLAAAASFEQIPYGLAKTGSLASFSSPSSPRTVSLVPPLHIGWLKAEHIVSDFSNLLSRFNAKQFPSNIVLISGPSKTADIELELVYGIHGPRELCLLLTQ